MKKIHWRTLLKRGGWRPTPYAFGPAYARGEERIQWDWERVRWSYSHKETWAHCATLRTLLEMYPNPK